jgi:hypothetical protein
MELNLTVPSDATVNVIDVMVKIVDHLHDYPSYSQEQRDSGIANAEALIAILKSTTGNRTAKGLGVVHRTF